VTEFQGQEVVLHPENKRFRAMNGVLFSISLKYGTAIGNVVNVNNRKRMANVIQIIDIVESSKSVDYDEIHERANSGNVIIPPFSTNRPFFGGYGIAKRVGNIDPYTPPEVWNVLIDRPVYNPYIREFVPEGLGEVRVSPPIEERRGWNLRVSNNGNWGRPPNVDELSMKVQPRNIFFLSYVDLFLARAVAALKGEELPTRPVSPEG
jgi:hypothetical protein